MAIIALFMLNAAVSFPAPIVEYIFTCYKVMNIPGISEFSFGKHFPEMTQPLDNSSEVTHDSASLLLLENLRLADVPCRICRINSTCVSFQQRTLPQGDSTNKSVQCHTLRTTAQTAFGRPGNILED